MPMIGGRYYANPAYGEAMERGREEDEREAGGMAAQSQVHRIHIAHDDDGIRVRVLHHGPGSDESSPEPSGRFSTHHFEHDDHDGVGEFVARVLREGRSNRG